MSINALYFLWYVSSVLTRLSQGCVIPLGWLLNPSSFSMRHIYFVTWSMYDSYSDI